MNEVDYMDDEINLGKMFKFLCKKVWILILAALIGTMIGFAYHHFTATTTYESSAVFYAYNKKTSADENTVAVSNLATNSIAVLKQTSTLQAVINSQSLSYTSEALQKMITAEVETSTDVFSVKITASDPYEAKKIIDGIVAVLPSEVSKVIEVAALKVVDAGKLNLTPNKPGRLKYLIIGFACGLFIALFIVVLIYILGKKVHDDDFVNRLPFRKPILIALPNSNNKRSSSNAAEKYDLFRKNMLFALDSQQSCTVFGITSAMQKEGKSVAAFNLAHSFAESSKKVLLMEGNLRTPVLANRLNLQSTIGLAEVLEGRNKIEEVIQISGIHEKLQIMVAGNAAQNPTILLEGKNMAEMMVELRKAFDCIIVDLPSINDGTDALTLASYIDGLVMVVREEYSEMPALKEAVQKLNFAKANLLGFVYTAKHAGRRAAGTNK